MKCKSVVNQVGRVAVTWDRFTMTIPRPPPPLKLDKRRSYAPPRGANCVWSKQVPGSNRGELRCELVLPWGCSCSRSCSYRCTTLSLLPFPSPPFRSISFQRDISHPRDDYTRVVSILVQMLYRSCKFDSIAEITYLPLLPSGYREFHIRLVKFCFVVYIYIVSMMDKQYKSIINIYIYIRLLTMDRSSIKSTIYIIYILDYH